MTGCAECARLVRLMEEAQDVWDWSRVTDCVVLLRRHAATCENAKEPRG
ncbi:hypothetical protein V1J52_08570 [Streptomyces sp. TRM 70351]|nr:hypothetical protein [Streptomyces sp. TRM 70351]MEE1928246.1 hypothetical protein [Streptomyces sp. TRM 70351]